MLKVKYAFHEIDGGYKMPKRRTENFFSGFTALKFFTNYYVYLSTYLAIVHVLITKYTVYTHTKTQGVEHPLTHKDTCAYAYFSSLRNKTM